MKRSYVILILGLVVFFGLHQFKERLESAKAEELSTQNIEEYVERIRQCRLKFPRANATELHECAE